MVERVLVIDNDPDILELIQLGLQETGYIVKTAPDGLAALKLMKQDPPDVVITDLIMPDIDGEKLLRIIRANPQWDGIRTVVLSGVAAEAPSIKARIPCDVYIAKGALKDVLELLTQTLKDFNRMKALSIQQALGVDRIYARRITRELISFREQYSRLFDHIQEGLCVTTEEGHVLWGNQSFFRLLGQPEESVLGTALPEIVSGIDELYERLEHVRETHHHGRSRWHVHTGETNMTVRYLTYETEGSMTRIFLSWTTGWSHPDNLPVRNILETMGHPLITVGPDLTVSYANTAARAFMPEDLKTMVGRPVTDLFQHRESNWDRWLTVLLDGAVREDQRQPFFRTRLQTTGSDPKRVDILWNPLHHRQTGTAGLIGELVDPVKIRNQPAEQDLKGEHLLHELHHRVNHTLQVIVSLVRISSPEDIESRMDTLVDVFNEVYREPTMAVPAISQVIESVIDRMMAAFPPETRREIHVEPNAQQYQVRQAMPIALLVNEVLFHLTENIQIASIEAVSVSLTCQGHTDRVLGIDVHAYGDAQAFSTRDGETVCNFGESMVDLLVQQLNGSYSLQVSPMRCQLAVKFAAPGQVGP